jgi:hypothetical protein
MERGSDLELTTAMTAMWHIWDARNKVCEGENLRQTIATKVKAYIEMITHHPYKPATTHRRETTSSRFKWSPPLEGTVLVNVDAAIFSSSRRMGINIVIWDHTDRA